MHASEHELRRPDERADVQARLPLRPRPVLLERLLIGGSHRMRDAARVPPIGLADAVPVLRRRAVLEGA